MNKKQIKIYAECLEDGYYTEHLQYGWVLRNEADKNFIVLDDDKMEKKFRSLDRLVEFCKEVSISKVKIRI